MHLHNRIYQSSKCVVSSDVCMLPKAIGSCHSAIQRYFFNEATATCEGFLYSGCGGNANSFDTLEECKKSCDKHIRKFEVSKGKGKCITFKICTVSFRFLAGLLSEHLTPAHGFLRY